MGIRSLTAAVILTMQAGATLVFATSASATGFTPTLDPSFGSGGMSAHAPIAILERGLALQPDGKVVVAGALRDPVTWSDDMAVTRFNADGTVDTSFGVGGAVTADFDRSEDAEDVAIQPDGKIVVVGRAEGFSPAQVFYFLRFLPDGRPDPSFGGGDGRIAFAAWSVTLGGAYGVTLQPDGKILAVGATGDHANMALVRLLPDGTADKTFGSGGVAYFKSGSGFLSRTVVVQSDGNILAGGGSYFARLLPNGKLDTTFGTGGSIRMNFAPGYNPRLVDLLPQPDGGLIAANDLTYWDGNDHGYYILDRYTSSGQLDPTFGSGGRVVTDTKSGMAAALQQPDGRILAVGVQMAGGHLEGGNLLIRYLPSGQLDPAFGTGGTATTYYGDDTAIGMAVLRPDGRMVTGCCTSVARWNVGAPSFPTLTGVSAAATPEGSLTLQFSRPVRGVSPASITVHALGVATPVTGTVAPSPSVLTTNATWTPSTPLVPGQTYLVSVDGGIVDGSGNGNRIYPATRLWQPSTRIENGSPALIETWDRDTNYSASGGAYHSSQSPGASMSLTFSGSSVTLLADRAADGGYAKVTLDGIAQTVSFFNPATQWKYPVWTATNLGPGGHTVTVAPLGTKPAAAKAAWVRVDAFNVDGTVLQEDNARVVERFGAHADSAGGTYDLVTHVAGGDSGGRPKFTATFFGTGVDVYGTRSPSSGKAAIYVDGAFAATITLTAAAASYGSLLYSSKLLPAKAHVIRVETVGSTTGADSDVGIDYLNVRG